MSTMRRVWKVPAAKASIVVLAGVAVLVVAGGWLAPHDPLAQQPSAMLQGPSGAHLLGTDYLGRDVLSRLMAGTRVSVAGALEAVATAVAIGILPGLASAWLGRRFEWFALRITDTLMVVPFTVFAIAVVGTLGNGLHQSMIAIGILMSPLYFRVTRAVTLGLRQQQYVEAAELMGASQWWILRKHIWSKVLPTIAVTTAQAVGTALLVMASLTFPGSASRRRRRPGAACSPATWPTSTSSLGRRSTPACSSCSASAPSTCWPTSSARPLRTPSAAPGGAGGPSTQQPASSPERPSAPR
jgi:peptide/nickel transport system permease protein